MKNLAMAIATAAVLYSLIPQAAQAQVYPYGYNGLTPYNGVVGYNGIVGYNGYNGVNDPNYGGATVYSDGSFSNNGISWNGADPTGGATGIRRGWTGASGLYAPARRAPLYRVINGRLYRF